MNNKTLRLFLIFLVYLTVILSIIPTPAYALKITINPDNSIISSTNDSYSAKLEPTDGDVDFFFLNLTISAGYKLILPPTGATIGNYTMYDSRAGKNKVIINIISNNPDSGLVDVLYSTDYGLTYSNSNNQKISNMSIGASNLIITKPTSSTPGYFNLSLGGTAGPICPTNNRVTLALAKGTLTNPSTVGKYTWNLVAKNSPTGTPFTSSNDVRVAAGGGSRGGYYSVTPTPAPTSTVAPTPTAAVTLPTTTPPQPAVTTATEGAPTGAASLAAGTLTGILAALFGLAIPVGEVRSVSIFWIIGLIIAVGVLYIIRRKRYPSFFTGISRMRLSEHKR